jgi:3-deoxy-7-phosphoheptulonate synthase
METAAVVIGSPDLCSVPYRLASRQTHRQDTVVLVGNVLIGGKELVVIGGPCAVESREQTIQAAIEVQRAGGHILRGGAFKPRTSPYEFRGLGEEGLKILAEARSITGMPVVTEVMSEHDVDLIASYADMLQIGSRNMSNFALLEAAAQAGKPILLKRGMQSTIKEWLLSAEYVLAQGNPNVVLVERGIRSFDSDYTRNTMDLNAVVVAKHETHLPVLVDPSHGTGRREMVAPLSKAAIMVGADGLIVEMHPEPELALCDGKQSLSPSAFDDLMHDITPCAGICGRTLSHRIAA